MELTLIKNDDDARITLYRLSRAIYAETGAKSLCLVEAFASMIRNLCIKSKRQLADIAIDESIFKCVNRKSKNHNDMFVNAENSAFQMCVRTVKRMLGGQLSDSVFGATRFHSDDAIPHWATAIGHIAEVDGFLFYE